MLKITFEIENAQLRSAILNTFQEIERESEDDDFQVVEHLLKSQGFINIIDIIVRDAEKLAFVALTLERIARSYSKNNKTKPKTKTGEVADKIKKKGTKTESDDSRTPIKNKNKRSK